VILLDLGGFTLLLVNKSNHSSKAAEHLPFLSILSAWVAGLLCFVGIKIVGFSSFLRIVFLTVPSNLSVPVQCVAVQ